MGGRGIEETNDCRLLLLGLSADSADSLSGNERGSHTVRVCSHFKIKNLIPEGVKVMPHADMHK